MEITVRLNSEHYSNYQQGIIGVGTPLNIYIESGTLFAEQVEDAAGWYQRLSRPEEKALVQLNHNRYAFCGQVQDVHVDQDDLDIYYFVLLDCGLPVSLLVSDLRAETGVGDLGRNVPDPGTWLIGVTHLSIDWAEDMSLPVAEAVQGSVTRVERLVLRPGPGFGEFRSELELPLTPLAPDQVYLTLKIRDRLL